MPGRFHLPLFKPPLDSLDCLRKSTRRTSTHCKYHGKEHHHNKYISVRGKRIIEGINIYNSQIKMNSHTWRHVRVLSAVHSRYGLLNVTGVFEATLCFTPKESGYSQKLYYCAIAINTQYFQYRMLQEEWACSHKTVLLLKVTFVNFRVHFSVLFCWCVQSQAACFQRPEHSFWLITRYWITGGNGPICVPV
jgi:hypothetical protein